MIKASRKKGFTLLELLVVIAIIGFLASVVTVVLTDAKHSAQNTRTISQNAEFGQAALLYQEDHNGLYPNSFYQTGTKSLYCLGTGCIYRNEQINTPINESIALGTSNKFARNQFLTASPLSSYIPEAAKTANVEYLIGDTNESTKLKYKGTVYLCTIPTDNPTNCTEGTIIYPLYGQDCPLNANYIRYDSQTKSILCAQNIVAATNAGVPKKGQGVGPFLPSNQTPVMQDPVSGGNGGDGECDPEDDEADCDDDGVDNGVDNCPDDYNLADQEYETQLDSDGDGMGDACDTATPWGVCAPHEGLEGIQDMCSGFNNTTSDDCSGNSTTNISEARQQICSYSNSTCNQTATDCKTTWENAMLEGDGPNFPYQTPDYFEGYCEQFIGCNWTTDYPENL